MFSAVSRGIPSFGDLSWKAPCIHGSIAPLLANTLAPAAGVSIGQTLTANANGALASDPGMVTQPPVLVGDRVLVAREASPKNGIYTIVALGDATHPWQLRRATDADTSAELPTGTEVLVTADFSLRALRSDGLFVSVPDLHYTTGAGAAIILRNPDGSNAGLTGKEPVVNVFTASGTWTLPPLQPPNWLLVEVVGGGGQGGGAPAVNTAGDGRVAAGGGAGGYSRRVYSQVELTGDGTVTVGAGGSTGGAGAAGQNGGDSSFQPLGGHLMTGNGGNGANASAAERPIPTSDGGYGTGGGASGGDINIPGNSGTIGLIGASMQDGGKGGASQLGPGGDGFHTTTTAATSGAGHAPAGGYGGGGGGASGAGTSNVARAGGAGAGGVVIVTEYYGP